MERVFIIGTGLIGASTGLALRAAGFAGRIDGWDTSQLEMAGAVQMGAIDGRAANREDALELARLANVVVLAVPVLAIKDWMQQLAPALRAGQLVTDVGSTKLEIVELAQQLFMGDTTASFLPGHPMAGKESGGALLAEAGLFDGAMWLFTPTSSEMTAMEKEWRGVGWMLRLTNAGYGCDTARRAMCLGESSATDAFDCACSAAGGSVWRCAGDCGDWWSGVAGDDAPWSEPVQYVAGCGDDQYRSGRGYFVGSRAEVATCAGESANAGVAG